MNEKYISILFLAEFYRINVFENICDIYAAGTIGAYVFKYE